MLKVLFSFLLLLSSCAQTTLYSNKCFEYLKAKEYKRAIESGEKSLNLYPRNTDQYVCVSNAYLQSGDLDSAIETMLRAEKFAPSNEDLAVIYNRLGFMYSLKGDIEKAMVYHKKHFALSHELGDKKGMVVSLINIADIYQKKGDLEEALSRYKSSLEVSEESKDLSFIHASMADIYSRMKRYKNAAEHYEISVEYAKRAGDKHLYAKALLNLGDTYRIMGDFKKSLDYLNEGLMEAKNLQDRRAQAYAYRTLGFLYKDKGDRNRAKFYLEKAIGIYGELGLKEDAKELSYELSKLK